MEKADQQANSISSQNLPDAPPAPPAAAEQEGEPAGGATVVFQSRLQAKRLERMHQRHSQPEDDLQEPSKSAGLPTSEQQQQQSSMVVRPRSHSKSGAVRPTATTTTTTTTTTPRPYSSHSHHHHQYQYRHLETATELTESNAQRRMMRGEARRTVMGFGGTVWDALRARDNLELLRCFFVVEGAQKLLNRRSSDLADGGRSLLHLASWLGDEEGVRFLTDAGAEIDAIDTVPSKTTPLLEASRAGHRTICVLLLQSGANAMHRDCHGDTAFHWAARCGHGTLLLEMALELEKIEGRSSLAAIWTMKNLKGKTVLEYVKANAFVMPLLQKRLGAKFPTNATSEKRKSRFPFKTAAMGASTRGLLSNSSARSMKLTPPTVQEENGDLLDSPRAFDSSPPSREQTPLTGVQTLGLDVASFAYKSRDELASSTAQSIQANLKLMEGFILAVSPNDKNGKKVWQTVFLKLDDISAKLVAFTDRSQYCVQWSLPLVGADIATPIPGEPNHGVNVDDTPFCFYVRNNTSSNSNKALAGGSGGSDEWHYLAAPSDEIKKQWMKLLLKTAKDGPRTPRFANVQAENEFSFQARVIKFRTHDGGKHAVRIVSPIPHLGGAPLSLEFLVIPNGKMAARRLAKQWDVWHRFSEFDALNEALKLSLGTQLSGIDFVKHRRDALRSLFGSALEHDFLEERRLQLDTYITRVCDLNSPVEFFKHHADPNLKKFFCFDEHCQNVDESPRKTSKGSRTKEQKASRKSDKSERDDDSNRQSVSSSHATSDADSRAEYRYSESNSVGPAQNDSLTQTKHRHHDHSDKTKTVEGKSSDKRERRASKKKEKKNRLKGDALSPSEDTDILRSASPTSAH